MIRIALDRSAVTNAAHTGIARYIDELAKALRYEPDVCLVDGEEFDLWGGAGRTIRGFVNEYVHLPARLRKAGIHVYHAAASRAPARRLAVPLVITIHDLAAYEFPGMQGWYRGARLRRQLRRAVALASRIVVPCDSVRREIMLRFPRFGEKIRVVHHGVADVFDRCRCAWPTPTFVTVATLERRKNLTTLIDAFAQVSAQWPEARLRLIGQPHNDADAIRAHIDLRGIAAAVSLEGYLSDDAVAAAYAGATATVYPSLYEGFGLPAIESMAAGAPVIASDIAATREVAGCAALLVDPLDSSAMATAMLRLIEDTDLNDALSIAGRARAALFTWERSAREHIQVYEEAIG